MAPRRRSALANARGKRTGTELDLLATLLATVGGPRTNEVEIPILTARTKDDDEFAARSARYPRKHRARRR